MAPMNAKSTPLRCPQAPVITIDTSAVEATDHTTTIIPHSSPAIHSGNSNSLAIPTAQPDIESPASDQSTLRHSSVDLLSPAKLSPTSTKIPTVPISLLFPVPSGQAPSGISNSPFSITPVQLARLFDPKSPSELLALGGLSGLESGLRTDRLSGLPSDDEASLADRRRVFGANVLPRRKSKSFLRLAWIALQDKVLVLLSVAAVVSLALGLYQTFGQEKHEGAKVEWVEGVAIVVAISIVVVVGALNDWQKERQFRKLSAKRDERVVNVVRSGKTVGISVHDVLVGDVMVLEQGDVLPVDGVYVDGHNVSCDESSATGESDLVKKLPADQVVRALEEGARNPRKLDPFIISGTRVLDGVGTFLVTAVGPNSGHGRTMISLQDDPGLTPLQSKLNILAGYIAKLGSAAGLLLFVVLLIEFLARLPHNHDSPEEKGQDFLRILITAITIIVVAVPEGLPLAVTLSLAFATKKMTKENNLVRHLQSCETMGNATVICSDKTGTLTENVMTVVAGALGKGGLRFRDQTFEPHDSQSSTAQVHHSVEKYVPGNQGQNNRASEVPIAQLSAAIAQAAQDLLRSSIALNTTAFESGRAFVGTKTETALLDWARRCFALDDLAVERVNHRVAQLFPFNSKHKCMGAVVPLPQGGFRLLVKGAPEVLLDRCNAVLGNPTMGLMQVDLAPAQRDEISGIISEYAGCSLRTLALAYTDLERWPPSEDASSVGLIDIARDMTWIGVVGIQDPVRDGVRSAVKDCRTASVAVKMVTGDNIDTARAIARQCGILSEGGLVMEGQEFRRLSDDARASVVKDLCVLARSSPEDKRVLVNALRANNEIVAVTGDGTNDAPALKAADVGFSMGITGTEVAKEASDIILMDDNFSSIVKALAWGRAINDSVKKFLQFQLTVNITAVIVTFVSAVSDDNETSVLNAVQLLWVNLIMDTFAALALATDPPTGSLLHRRPEPRGASLISLTMWKMILGQSLYQLIVCFVLWFVGPHFLGYPERHLRTLIFNAFVFMQIFKLLNSRRIDNQLNILEGLHRNHLFMLMMSIMIAGQVIIVFFGGEAFVVVRLTGVQWAISLVLGALSIPVGVLIRLLPDEALTACIGWVDRHWPAGLRYRRKNPGPEPEPYDLEAALGDIRDDLAFLKKVRGGRIWALSRAIENSRDTVRRSRNRGGISRHRPASPMLSVVGMPGIVAGSVGGLSSAKQVAGY